CVPFLYLSFVSLHHPATPEIYPLSLHDALPISSKPSRRTSERRTRRHHLADQRLGTTLRRHLRRRAVRPSREPVPARQPAPHPRSEEHTSELQSRENLVCRLLLEKKKKQIKNTQ